MRTSLLVVLALFFTALADAQQLKGTVAEAEGRKALYGVVVHNINTGIKTLTDSQGYFSINVQKEEVVQFSLPGFKSEIQRITQAEMPFIKVFLTKPFISPLLAEGRTGIWKIDSMRNHELYKMALEFGKFSTLDMIQHPFSALSKRNQRIWAFQKEYEWFEREKYIDYTFNTAIVAQVTGLSGDSAQAYVKAYRPAYEQLRSMTEFEFYAYIAHTVSMYRDGYIDPKRGRAPVRGTN